MPKDVPHAGVFHIAKLNSSSSPTRFKRHHYQLAWEGKHLEYDQKWGRGPYRQRLDLSTVFGVALVDEPGRRGAGKHILLTGRGAQPVRYKIKPTENDFHNLLYWLLVSLSKHGHAGTVGGLQKASLGLRKKSRQQKLRAREDFGHYGVDHGRFLNALSLFESVERQDGSDAALRQFGRRAPQRPERVEISIFSADKQPGGDDEPLGLYEGEGGTIIKSEGARLGAGTSGVVKEAQRIVKRLQRDSGRYVEGTEPCVIKVAECADMGGEFTDEAEEMLKEGQVLAALGEHPNIIKLIDVRMSDTVVIMMLEKGACDLASRIESLGQARLSPAAIRTLTQDILCGLAQMHARRIYHLDVKPENVMLFTPAKARESDPVPDDRAKLIDFGKSKTKLLHRGDMFDEAWHMYGTKRYIPPESYDLPPSHGEHLAKRDAYAAGIMIFGMLLGPRYGWVYAEPNARLESKEQIVARAEFWREKVHTAEALRQLQEDKLHDISSMAAGLADPNRDHRISIEDAYKVVEPPQTKKKKKAPTRRSLL